MDNSSGADTARQRHGNCDGIPAYEIVGQMGAEDKDVKNP
jgi:hypothetical protein